MGIPVKIDPARARKVAIPVAAVLLLAFILWKVFGPGFLYAGTVEATEVDLSARVSSVIDKLEVSEGDSVQKGQGLIRLACEDVRLAADLAESNYKRAVELFQSGSMSKAEFDRTRYQREDASVRRSWCGIRSPISGVVLDVYHESGELVGPGTKLCTIADLSEVWAYIYVAQPLLARIRPGMEVTGSLPEMRGKKFAGRIARIREEAEFTPRNVQTREERTRLVYGVKVAFPNPDGILKPGMTIEVRLPVK
jgi:HlyD family secretion protein